MENASRDGANVSLDGPVSLVSSKDAQINVRNMESAVMDIVFVGRDGLEQTVQAGFSIFWLDSVGTGDRRHQPIELRLTSQSQFEHQLKTPSQ